MIERPDRPIVLWGLENQMRWLALVMFGLWMLVGSAGIAGADPGGPCDGHGGIDSASAGFEGGGNFYVGGVCGDGTSFYIVGG